MIEHFFCILALLGFLITCLELLAYHGETLRFLIILKCGQAQLHYEGTAMPNSFRLYRHSAIALINYLLDDREPEAKPLAFHIGSALKFAKALEHVRDITLGDAHARIIYLDRENLADV